MHVQGCSYGTYILGLMFLGALVVFEKAVSVPLLFVVCDAHHTLTTLTSSHINHPSPTIDAMIDDVSHSLNLLVSFTPSQKAHLCLVLRSTYDEVKIIA
jgi:hypothetical protein